MALAEVFTHLRIFVSLGPGLAFLLFLHEAIRLQRPDIVDKDNRVRNIETYELLESYDFIVVGGGSAGDLKFVLCSNKQEHLKAQKSLIFQVNSSK